MTRSTIPGCANHGTAEKRTVLARRGRSHRRFTDAVYRCKDGDEITPACYGAECSRACKSGTCVGIPTLQQDDCNANLCGSGS